MSTATKEKKADSGQAKKEPVRKKQDRSGFYHMGITRDEDIHPDHVKNGRDFPSIAYQCWTLGGFDFPYYTENVQRDEGTGETLRERVMGVKRFLSEEDIVNIERHMAREIFRPSPGFSKNRRGNIYNVKHPMHRKQKIDRPIGEFIYLKKISEEEFKPVTPKAFIPAPELDDSEED